MKKEVELLQEQIEEMFTNMCEHFGENPLREGLLETPKRWMRAWFEMCSGYRDSPQDHLTKHFKSEMDGIIMCRDIELYSTCEHHLLPFFGRAHISYIPSGKVVGISKIVRMVNSYAKRFQIQETLTNEIADCLFNSEIQPRGVMVIIEAQHLCMKARGVKNHSSVMVTSSIRGCYSDHAIRMETLKLIGK